MSESELKTEVPTNQSFEEFRGWLRGFLEGTDDGLTPGGVKRIQDELNRVDPSMAAAPPVTITRHLDPLWQQHPYRFLGGGLRPHPATLPGYVGNEFPWPGGVTICNSVANAH